MKPITVTILLALAAGSAVAQEPATPTPAAGLASAGQVPAITAALAAASEAPANVPQLPPMTPANSPLHAASNNGTGVPPAPNALGGSVQANTPVVLQPTPAPVKRDPAIEHAKARFDLEQRAQIAEYIGSALQKPTTASHIGSVTVYSYRDGGIYTVYAGVERTTDITLQPGETLAGDGPSAGDTARWIVGTMTSGEGSTKQVHVIVKPTDPGISTDMMLATNKHFYILDLRAVDDWYMPSVRWDYPAERIAQLTAQNQANAAKQAVETPVSVSPDKLDFNYKIKGRYSWAPRQVFSDGVKTYVRMPANLNATDAPALFLIEDGKPMLVNYRVKGVANGTDGPTYEIDRVFDRAELRVGAKHVVTIIRHPRWYQ
jgi:type IV secretion system protein VirB9